MPRRRKRRAGVLTGLGKGSRSGPSKRKPWYKRILTWAGAVLLVGVFVVILAGVFIGLLNPRVTVSEEGEFVVVEIRETPDGPGVAVVEIRDEEVPIPLDPERPAGLEVGARLYVAYAYTQGRGPVRVERWRLADADPSERP